jgi:hypothetical protein
MEIKRDYTQFRNYDESTHAWDITSDGIIHILFGNYCRRIPVPWMIHEIVESDICTAIAKLNFDKKYCGEELTKMVDKVADYKYPYSCWGDKENISLIHYLATISTIDVKKGIYRYLLAGEPIKL